MRPEYNSGSPARKQFERTMTALFRAPKAVKIPAKSAPKKKEVSR